MRWRTAAAIAAAISFCPLVATSKADTVPINNGAGLVTGTVTLDPNPANIQEGQSVNFNLQLGITPTGQNPHFYNGDLQYGGSFSVNNTTIGTPPGIPPASKAMTLDSSGSTSVKQIWNASVTYPADGSYKASFAGTGYFYQSPGNAHRQFTLGTNAFDVTVTDIPLFDTTGIQLTFCADELLVDQPFEFFVGPQKDTKGRDITYTWIFDGLNPTDTMVVLNGGTLTHSFDHVGVFSGSVKAEVKSDQPGAVYDIYTAHFTTTVVAPAVVPVPMAAGTGLSLLAVLGGVAGFRRRFARG